MPENPHGVLYWYAYACFSSSMLEIDIGFLVDVEECLPSWPPISRLGFLVVHIRKHRQQCTRGATVF